LVWKDQKGKRKYITPTANSSNAGVLFSCPSPRRLPNSTVDSLLGKLRASFNEFGRRGECDPRLLLGNPVTDFSLKQYLKAVSAEQLQTQAMPKEAPPFFVNAVTPFH